MPIFYQTRREFVVDLGKILLGGAIAVSGVSALESLANAAEKTAQEEKVKSVDTITEEEIAKYMAMSSVEEILKDSGVIYLNPKNFDKDVYGSKKPVLVMFYGGLDYSKREAILFRVLSSMYPNIKFGAYFLELDYSTKKPVIESQARIPKRENILDLPSIAMYSLFDLTKGETLERNNGRIKQIDILHGGPLKNEHILTDWVSNLTKFWIPTNITRPNGEYSWRNLNKKENEGGFEKVFYNNQ